jgi:hypothetical protein
MNDTRNMTRDDDQNRGENNYRNRDTRSTHDVRPWLNRNDNDRRQTYAYDDDDDDADNFNGGVNAADRDDEDPDRMHAHWDC